MYQLFLKCPWPSITNAVFQWLKLCPRGKNMHTYIFTSINRWSRHWYIYMQMSLNVSDLCIRTVWTHAIMHMPLHYSANIVICICRFPRRIFRSSHRTMKGSHLWCSRKMTKSTITLERTCKRIVPLYNMESDYAITQHVIIYDYLV